jgi:hypothetical protein
MNNLTVSGVKDGNVIGSKITFSLARWDKDAGSLSE